MKRYRCHKVVEATEVVECDAELRVVTTYDDAGNPHRVGVPEDFFGRGMPSRGDYLVRYLPDGYLSWSPKSVFEDGYTAEPETMHHPV